MRSSGQEVKREEVKVNEVEGQTGSRRCRWLHRNVDDAVDDAEHGR
jgi:hypothetical protein